MFFESMKFLDPYIVRRRDKVTNFSPGVADEAIENTSISISSYE